MRNFTIFHSSINQGRLANKFIMEIKQIKYFLTVVEAGSIGKEVDQEI